ncbi:hypothetical protein A2U01_0116919, partial [Trifolium medium]|nr:hypothetical protein [Trifolium medium]
MTIVPSPPRTIYLRLALLTSAKNCKFLTTTATATPTSTKYC